MVSCASSYINPNTFWPVSFIGFAFPVVLVINMVFLLGWALIRHWLALVQLAAIALSWVCIYATFAFHFTAEQKDSGLKLMTWNVKNFDLYNWSHNTETREKMMQLIAREKPDVLCLQEFYTNNQLFKNLAYIRDTLGYPYYYFFAGVNLSKLPKTKLQKTLWKSGLLNQQWGVATFSKYPITDSGKVEFKNAFANDCIYTDINFNGKTVRLYNVHFQSIHLGYDDYATIDSIESSQKTTWVGLKNIIKKMKEGYARRSVQAKAVAASMATYGGGKILCGDFNDVPVSYTYRTVKQDLQDAFVERGSGFGPTYVNRFSIFRIDYTLLDSHITINSYRTIKSNLSDHYPVCITFDL